VDFVRLEREIAQLKTALTEQACQSVADREAEREAIARELHDKFGQYLTVMTLELNAIGQQADLPPVLSDRLQTLMSLTAQAEHDVSGMAWQMRPVSLEGLDLKSACGQLAEAWSDRAALAFDLHLSLGPRKLPPLVETTLYRVLQEAITNVVKHANATRIGIILRAVSHEVVLVVEDDGSGFEHDKAENTLPPALSLGLRGIRERLALVGGILEIETSPGRGTTLLISVPL
jgi:signal transduction histidine kinase